MSTWIYQLNQKEWTPETFRYEIWENERWRWGYGKKRGEPVPATGDTLVFFYAPSAGERPGIYGWAVVERFDEDSGLLYFIPTTPTNYLKMDPWWNDDAQKLMDEIRGVMKQATLFHVPEDAVSKIRRGIIKTRIIA